MRCKQCDHALWNQPVPPAGGPRVCSECGTGYSAADFDFGRGKVRFCCPGCETGYYGTSRKGHLEPAEFDCVGCGARLTMDRCIIRAHDMEREGEAMQRVELPWIDPGAGGWFRRWRRTVGLSLSGGTKVAPLLNRPPDPLRAAAFASVNACLIACAGFAYFVLLPSMIAVGGGPQAFVLQVALAAASVVAIVLLGGLPALLCSFLPRKGEPIGFARAYEIAAYSSGSLIVGLIPCCGPPIGMVWWTVQVVQGMVSAFAGESLPRRIAAGLLAFVAMAAGSVGMVVMVSAF